LNSGVEGRFFQIPGAAVRHGSSCYRGIPVACSIKIDRFVPVARNNRAAVSL
jgi:hypothetical protein